jgi:hypothetical protein
LHGFHFLFTCKPASHATLCQWVDGLESGRPLPTLKLRVKGQSNRWEHHHYRWANQVPLTEGDDPLKVTQNENCCEGGAQEGKYSLIL